MKKISKNLLKSVITVGLIVLACNVTTTSQPYAVKSIGENRSKIVFNDSTSFEVDKILLPNVKNYLDDLILYEGKEKVEYLSRTYMGIYVDNVPYGTWGVTYIQRPYGDDYTLIAPFIVDKPNKLRTIVYHELNHKLNNQDHCHILCSEIMSAQVTNAVFYNNWKKQKKVMFLRKKHDSLKINVK